MTQFVSRRNLLAGLSGGLVAATASRADAAAAKAEAFGPMQDIYLSALNFVPISAADYAYGGSGGITMGTGNATFNCPIDLPVGNRLSSVTVYVDPNGSAVSFVIRRYRLAAALTIQAIGGASSTTGTGLEAVTASGINYTVVTGWTITIAQFDIDAGQVIYGARIRHQAPV